MGEILFHKLLSSVNEYTDRMLAFTAWAKIHSFKYVCKLCKGSWAGQNFCSAKNFGCTIHVTTHIESMHVETIDAFGLRSDLVQMAGLEGVPQQSGVVLQTVDLSLQLGHLSLHLYRQQHNKERQRFNTLELDIISHSLLVLSQYTCMITL